jgi:beta-phosphoglucomutase
MVRAVVFDFDGVIANSEPLHFRAFHDVLAAEGVALTEADYYARYLGYNDERAFREIGAERGRRWNDRTIDELIDRKARLMEEIERHGSILFPGVREAIEQLARQCPLAIASGALRAEIERKLLREQLSTHFSVIVAGDDGLPSKPAPDPYLRAVERLGATHGPMPPSHCVAVEDSPWGLESAILAGLRTVGITHTYGEEALARADAIIDKMSALTWEMVCSLDGRLDPGGSAQNSLF